MTRDATGAHTRQGPRQGPRQGSRQEPSPDRSPAAHRGRAATPPARARPPRSAQTKCCGGSVAALRRPVPSEGREKRSSSLLPLLCSAPRRFRLLGCGGARPEPRGAPPRAAGPWWRPEAEGGAGAESSGGGGAGGRTKRSAAGAGDGERRWGRDRGRVGGGERAERGISRCGRWRG